MNEEVNNFLRAWLLRPENEHLNPIAAATPTREAKEWMAKHLGVDRARIDGWFYRKRMKLKKQHNELYASSQLETNSKKVSVPVTYQQLPSNGNCSISERMLDRQSPVAATRLVSEDNAPPLESL